MFKVFETTMESQMSQPKNDRWINRFLHTIEAIGNKLPDPAILFLLCLLTVWILSACMAGVSFSEIDPRTGEQIRVQNLLDGKSISYLLANMISIFVTFPPLGMVLVAMLGVGVAEQSGYINTGLKMVLDKTPRYLLTPMVILTGILSHSAIDVGYVLVIPMGAIIFKTANRHPLAGILAAFAGVSGGFSANPVPSALDPLLQGFTQSAAQIIDPNISVNPLCNWGFTASSTLLIVLLGWFITDRIMEPRLNRFLPVDQDSEENETLEAIGPLERTAFNWASSALVLCAFLLVLFIWPTNSPLRGGDGTLTDFNAPLMKAIVPLLFLFFVIPGIIYGRLTQRFSGGKNVIEAMTKSISDMGHYVVMAFFCALFIDAFNRSNIGVLLATKGALFLKGLNLSGQVTVVGIIFLAAVVNLFVGSASAKWALLAPTFVPMLMQVGISPELAQAAYRIGDSSTNIITPLLPYFPLIILFCQKYVKKTGIGTLISYMLPYSVVFLLTWTLYLLVYWSLGLPLGLQASYTYP